MATENRLQREMTSRAVQERPKQWQQADLLPEPDKEPGYAYRWVRVSTLNDYDQRNITGKYRDAQTMAVDNNLMRQSDARMPIFKESKSSTSFGKGS